MSAENPHLLLDDIPRWYTLRWDRSLNKILISIRRDYITHAINGGDLAPWMTTSPAKAEEQVQLEFEFMALETRLGKETFGYFGAITRTKEDADWLTYQITVPRVNRCGESNSNPLPGLTKCLSSLLHQLSFPNKIPTEATDYQECTITIGGGVRGTAFVGGILSPSFVKKVQSICGSERVHIPFIDEVMREMHQQLHGFVSDYYEHSFCSYIDNGSIYLRCPGDACEVFGGRSNYGGRELSDHNVDTGTQQFTLLAGLVAFITYIVEMEKNQG